MSACSPLVDHEGDVAQTINGVKTSTVSNLEALLRNQAGRQVLLQVKPQKSDARDVVVVPMKSPEATKLRAVWHSGYPIGFAAPKRER